MTFKSIMQRDTNKFVAKKRLPLIRHFLVAQLSSLYFLFFNANYRLELFNFLFIVTFACPQKNFSY